MTYYSDMGNRRPKFHFSTALLPLEKDMFDHI